MAEMQIAREVLSHLLVDLKDIDESVVRGERRLGKQTYAVAYVDLADQVVARSQNLKEFQERILGDDFFDSTGDLRWNKYLYIVAGPNSVADAKAFATAKTTIEADKDYARKRVVSKAELESLLGGPKLFEPASASQAVNVLADWEQRLRSSELDLLLECPTPRTTVVDRVAQGTARTSNPLERTRQISTIDAHLATSRLTELTIENFRPIHNGKTYKFGQVNLLIGPNGSGKTSLLEAVEFLYCGHNRRVNSTSSLRVNAKFSTIKSDEEYLLTSTVEASRIKARCLAWYNRDERNAKAIVDGFTRYNFLDTDAAFRISADLEPSEVSTDLSRLLIGPSAAVTWDYLTKIHTDIDRALEKTQGNVEREKLTLEANEKTLKEMRDKPSVAKALTEAYRQTLFALRWLHIPNNPKLEPSEGNLLLSVLGHVQTLFAAGVGARTVGSLRARQVELNQAVSVANPHATELAELYPKQQALIETINSNNTAIWNIDRWIAYASSGYPRLRELVPKAAHAAQEMSGRLGKFAAGHTTDIASEYQAVSLEVAKQLALNALSFAQSRIEELSRLADSHGRAAAARTSAANSLKEAVLTSLTQTSSTDICPVCKTTHPPGELSRLISAITESAALNPELLQITEALQSAQVVAQTTRANLDAIQFADAVALQLGLGANLTAPDVLHQLFELRAQSAAHSEAARSASDELHRLGAGGLSSNEYDLVWGQISSIFSDSEATIDMATTERQELLADIERKQHELSEIQSKILAAGFAIRDICKQVVTPQWNTSVKFNDTFATLTALRDEFEFMLAHIPQIQSQIAINEETSIPELQAGVASAFAAFKEAISSEQSEATSSTELIALARTVSNGKTVLHNAQEQTNALRKAVDVLSNLLDESSLEKATQESLAAIGGQINEVFSRIHAPREYEYVGKQDALLRTVITHEARTLEQVSTGQRAAFALSIFLALNSTAKSAPPVLLIDDPIAHIDDLNALSFLDYLRDLAVNSGRQIFFATADTRIASLFTKKFSFLGDSFKSIQLARVELT